MKTLLKILIGITLSLNVTFMLSQTFQKSVPDDFRYVGLQIDGGGSLDKEGVNSVISFGGQVGGSFEVELQVQTLFTGKYIERGLELDYADIQLGFAFLIPIGDRIILSSGVHAGQMYRPKSRLFDKSYNGFSGGFIGGFTGKAMLFLGRSKRFGFVLSGAYDYRYDLVKYGDYFRINIRAGGFLTLNK